VSIEGFPSAALTQKQPCRAPLQRMLRQRDETHCSDMYVSHRRVCTGSRSGDERIVWRSALQPEYGSPAQVRHSVAETIKWRATR
jgi:hypothetical protein